MKQHSIAKIVRTWFMATVFDEVYTRYYQLVLRLATAWTVQGWNPGVGKIFRTRPVRPWGPPSLLYNEYRVFPRDKAAGPWNWPPTPSSAEVKERAGLNFYSPSGTSWPFYVEIYLFLYLYYQHMIFACSMILLQCESYSIRITLV